MSKKKSKSKNDTWKTKLVTPAHHGEHGSAQRIMHHPTLSKFPTSLDLEGVRALFMSVVGGGGGVRLALSPSSY
eukprot:scaffold5037_cov114-Isochrysis_galbana.AAC.4